VALVQITTDPPGAVIYVDRRDLGARGVSPRTLALDPGEHRILVEAQGWHPANSTPVNLVIGQTANVRVAMAQELGQVQVDGTGGATIRVDDEDGPIVGTIPTRLDLPPGPHTLIVAEEGRRTVRQPVTVAMDDGIRSVIELPLLTGTVVVNALERGGLIEIDGQARGFTPAVLNDVPIGAHKLKVSLGGFRTYETTVKVETDKSVTVDSDLVPQEEVTAASRITQDVEDAPASVTLVTAEELRAFGSQTLYDALAGTRGIYGTDDLTYQSLGFRGFARAGDYGNRVLVTMDGHTLNDDQLGASYVGYDLISDLQDVERIEVVRGPGSALYGTGAFFGVLNLVTRQDGTTRPPHISIAADGERTARASTGASGKIGDDGGWWISGGGAVSQGEDFDFPEYEAAGMDGRSVGADGFYSGGARARLWKGDVKAEAAWNARSKRIPTGAFETVLASPDSDTTDERGFAELRWEPTLSDKVRLYTRLFGDRYDFRGNYAYEDDTVHDQWHGTWTGAELRAVMTPSPAFRFTIGGEGDFHAQADLHGASKVSGTYLDEHPTYQVYAGYAVADIDAGKALSVEIGARTDYYSTFGLAVSPRAALILRPAAAHTIKLLAGRAFRAPSPYELYYNDDGDTQIAAPDLQPETIETGELEYTWRISSVTSATVAAYYDQIDSLIDLGTTDADLLQYANTDETVRTAGAEIEVRRAWRQGWMVAYTTSLQNARRGDLISGDELTNSPFLLASLKAAAPVGFGTAASRLRFESSRLSSADTRTDPALLWDVMLTGSVANIGLDWGFGVRNLLDWQYGHPGGEDLLQQSVPQPGRTIYAEGTLNF
jgi:outer membrane cobalamin receptor